MLNALAVAALGLASVYAASDAHYACGAEATVDPRGGLAHQNLICRATSLPALPDTAYGVLLCAVLFIGPVAVALAGTVRAIRTGDPRWRNLSLAAAGALAGIALILGALADTRYYGQG